MHLGLSHESTIAITPYEAISPKWSNILLINTKLCAKMCFCLARVMRPQELLRLNTALPPEAGKNKHTDACWRHVLTCTELVFVCVQPMQLKKAFSFLPCQWKLLSLQEVIVYSIRSNNFKRCCLVFHRLPLSFFFLMIHISSCRYKSLKALLFCSFHFYLYITFSSNLLTLFSHFKYSTASPNVQSFLPTLSK